MSSPGPDHGRGGALPAHRAQAAAVVVGSFVMLFDPIFQGLAIAMMFGAVASTALTLIVVPLLYYQFFKNRPCPTHSKKEPE